MQGRGFAYLSVVEWPDSLDEAARVRLLVEGAGLDPFAARQQVVRGAPQVVARLAPAEGQLAVEVLGNAGVVAFAPTTGEFAALGTPLRAKRLVPATGAPEPMYAVEPWRGEGRGLKAAEIFLLIRSRLKKVTAHRAPAADRSLGSTLGSAMAWGVTGIPVSGTTWTPQTTTSLAITDMLDLYLRDGSRVRVDGDKFSFDVLGEERGYSDGENMDRLALLLGGQAPRALVDTAFSRFVCPADIVRDALQTIGDASVRTRRDAPVFDFYSPWCYLMYRRLVGGGRGKKA